jgi:2-dehydropantoate 2-reductase
VRIAVYGAGGVGGLFGAKFAAAGTDVQLVARGAHLTALQQDGLVVETAGERRTLALPATDNPETIGPVDYVLVTVKSYDTENVAHGVAPLLHDNTAVISLQNGIDNEEILAGVVGRNRVMGGAAFLFSTIAEPGLVRHTGGPGRMVFGELDGHRSARGEQLLALCEEAGIPAELSGDIRSVLWSKFAFICAQAGMTATTRLPLGEIRETPASWAMFERILREVYELARAEGVRLPDDILEQHVAFAQALEPDSYSSLHHDLKTGHRMELEALHGTVVRRAAQARVAVPACEAVYAILRPWARRNEQMLSTRADA